MAQVHGGIPPMQVANLPPAAATPGPVEGPLDADEPMPLRCLLRREDTHIGHVQRHRHHVVHRDSSRSEPVPLSSHRDVRSSYDNVWLITAIPGEPLFFLIKWLGAGYLIWLGLKTFFTRRDPARHMAAEPTPYARAWGRFCTG